jgi:hypothetical protein
MREARLERRGRGCSASRSRARSSRQVDEIERAGALLQALVPFNGIAELVMQQSGEIAVGRVLKGVELAHQRLISSPHGVARHRRSVVAPAATASAPDVLVLGEIDRARFPAVGIGGVEPGGGADVMAQLANRRRVEIERIAQRRRRGRQPGEVVQLGEDAVQLLIAIERIAPPPP